MVLRSTLLFIYAAGKVGMSLTLDPPKISSMYNIQKRKSAWKREQGVTLLNEKPLTHQLTISFVVSSSAKVNGSRHSDTPLRAPSGILDCDSILDVEVPNILMA